MRESGCESPLHCVLTMTPVELRSGGDLGPTNVFYPSSLSGVVGLTDPRLKVKTFCTVEKNDIFIEVGGELK